ncbi:MAG: hypothetical protein GY918_14085, partial [Gammaproteobacteria bacterium]|nr:hypothetical protein [Gammaproteobacteria bacterium]
QEFRASGATILGRSGAEPLTLNRITSDGGILDFRKDGTTAGSIGTYVNLPYIGKNDVNLLFDPAGPHVIPRGTNGGARDGAINLGSSTNRFKNLHLSGGVNFDDNPTAVTGNVSSKTLDDYEEGTCNLKWSDGTNHSTYVGNKYTKVGRLVTVSGYIAGNVSGLTGTAVAQIAGFPFAFSDYGSFAVKLRHIDSPTGCIGIVGEHINSGSSAQLSFIVDNGNYSSVLVSDLSINSNDTYFDITYITTS